MWYIYIYYIFNITYIYIYSAHWAPQNGAVVERLESVPFCAQLDHLIQVFSPLEMRLCLGSTSFGLACPNWWVSGSFWQVTLDLWLVVVDAITMVVVALNVIVAFTCIYHTYHESSCDSCVLCLSRPSGHLWTKAILRPRLPDTCSTSGRTESRARPAPRHAPSSGAGVPETVLRCCAKAVWILSEWVGGPATSQSQSICRWVRLQSIHSLFVDCVFF